MYCKLYYAFSKNENEMYHQTWHLLTCTSHNHDVTSYISGGFSTFENILDVYNLIWADPSFLRSLIMNLNKLYCPYD